MKKAALIWIIAAFLMTGAAWADVEVNGHLENQERVRIAKDEDLPEDEEYPFDMMMADTIFDLKIRGYGMDDKARMFANIDFRHFAMSNDQEVELRIKEAWVGFYLDWFSFEIGKKLYLWGMADELNPTDLINPEDLRWFYTYDKPERKLGSYSANVAFRFSNFKIQGVWVPIFEPTLLPGSNENWTPWKLQLFYDLADLFPEYVDFRARQVPGPSIGNSSGAVKFSGTAGPVDFEAVVYDGYDHLPIFDVQIDTDPTLLVSGGKPLQVREHYQRFNAYGGSISAVAGPLTFRGEGAYYTERYYMHEIDPALLSVTDPLTAYNVLVDLEGTEFRSKKPSFMAAMGMDYRYSDLMYLNLQYFHIQILDYEDFLLDDEIDNGLSAKLEFTLLDETLKLATDGMVNFSQEDWFVNPHVIYLLTDELEIEGGVAIFQGDYETNFGEFDRNDYAYTRMRFSF